MSILEFRPAQTQPGLSENDRIAHDMATFVRRPALPADASDDLVLRLFQETSRQTPAQERVTCPIHLNWRDRCIHLHEENR